MADPRPFSSIKRARDLGASLSQAPTTNDLELLRRAIQRAFENGTSRGRYAASKGGHLPLILPTPPTTVSAKTGR